MDLNDLPDLIERSFASVAEVESWAEDRRVGGGTGFVARLGDDSAGPSEFVITNAHVLDDGPEMKVFFRDGEESTGKLLGTHPMVDIALFRLDEARSDALDLRGRDDFRLGEFVMALGHPFQFSWTVTSGLISGLDRPMNKSDKPNNKDSAVPITMLQTSADINYGNSGGPLIGLDGRAVGVNTSGITRLKSLFKVDFAIPGNTARLAAEAILNSGQMDHVPRPWTGLPIDNKPWEFPRDLVATYGVTGGAEVGAEPEPESPAHEAGFRKGDIVIEVEGRPVDDPGDIYTWMLDPDCLERESELKFVRDGEVKATVMRVVDRDST